MNRKIVILLVVLILIALLVGGLFFYYRFQLNSVAEGDQPQPATVAFVVEEGWSVEEIADQLYQQNLINSRLSFYWYLLSNGYWSQLRPGEYQLNRPITIPELVVVLIAGQNKEEKIVVPEGWRVDDIDNYLAEQKLIKKGQFKEQAQLARFTREFSFLEKIVTDKKVTATLEGFLFPDSYFIDSDFTCQALITKMLSAFQEKVYQEYWQEDRHEEIKTFLDLIVLASIVEKEADGWQDRRLVAGIFLKRLDRGYRLQSCATVNYLLGKPKDILTGEDLLIDSPYNSYRHQGLPPAPICNPGLESIKAVLNPQFSKYWYFLSDQEGQLHFAIDAKSHARNKDRYL
jgi:UPF0755 protein